MSIQVCVCLWGEALQISNFLIYLTEFKAMAFNLYKSPTPHLSFTFSLQSCNCALVKIVHHLRKHVHPHTRDQRANATFMSVIQLICKGYTIVCKFGLIKKNGFYLRTWRQNLYHYLYLFCTITYSHLKSHNHYDLYFVSFGKVV